MRKICLAIGFCFLLSSFTFAYETYESVWNGILKNRVVSGEVDGITGHLFRYQNIGNSSDYKLLLKELREFDTKRLKSKERKLAFWMNVYNIAAVKMIVDHYPLKSIKDKSSLFTPVWAIPVINVDGQDYSLEEIEHDILRPLGNPLIHFGIVCASLSCPNLRKEAYTVSKLSRQLDEQAREFLKNSGKGLRLRKVKKVVEVSQIFKWFSEDFDKNGGVRAFLKKYYDKDLSNYKISYLDYNWALNEQRYVVPKIKGTFKRAKKARSRFGQ